MLYWLARMDGDRTAATLPAGSQEKDVEDCDAYNYAPSRRDKWYRKLAKSWPEGKEVTASPLTAAITERIRANQRGKLQRQLDRFRSVAGLEEVNFMLSVLDRWEDIHGSGPTENFQRIAIAGAFDEVLTEKSGTIYIKASSAVADAFRRTLDLEGAN